DEEVPAFPAAPPPAAEDEAPASFRTRLRGMGAGTALAMLCSTVALFLASVPSLSYLTKPLSAVGLVIGLLAGVLPALLNKKGLGFPLTMTGLCLVVLLGVGSWPGPAAP